MTKPRFSARKLLRALLITVVSIVAVGLAFTYLVRPALTGPVTEITFDQYASIPNYDGSEYTVTDEEKLAQFADLLARHNAVPELVNLAGIPNGMSGCAGGTSSEASITFASGRVADLRVVESCGDAPSLYGTFMEEANDLLTSWKDPGPIASITFEQSKAVEGYDDGSYTITNTDQLGELSNLMDEHGVSPLLLEFQYSEPSECDGGTSTAITIEFDDGRVAEAVLEPSCDGSGRNAEFLDEATDLLESWKD